MAHPAPHGAPMPLAAPICSQLEDDSNTNLPDSAMMRVCTNIPPQTMERFAVIHLGVKSDTIQTIKESLRENVQNIGFKCLEHWRNSYNGPDACGTLVSHLKKAWSDTMKGEIAREHFAFLDTEHQMGKNI